MQHDDRIDFGHATDESIAPSNKMARAVTMVTRLALACDVGLRYATDHQALIRDVSSEQSRSAAESALVGGSSSVSRLLDHRQRSHAL